MPLSIDNALRYLKSCVFEPTVSDQEAALLVLALAQSSGIRPAVPPRLTQQLRGNDWKWIDTVELQEMALRLLALHMYDPTILDGTGLAQLAARLLRTEQAVGGPYAEPGHSPELLANALLAQLFTAFGSPLPHLVDFVQHIAYTNSQILTDPLTLWAVSWPSRLLKNPIKSDYLAHLPKAQQPNGSWSASHDLTSLTITAIAVCLLNSEPFTKPQARATARTAQNTVMRQVERELSVLQEPLQSKALQVWQSVVKADTRHEITHLPLFFKRSLKHPSKLLTDTACERLGTANFYTWMAYTIYDDFIDEEGEPSFLPVANYAHRASLWHYQEVDDSPSIRLVIRQSFTDMDIANAWELAHCRYDVRKDKITVKELPLYGEGEILARRASAHLLGPTILMLLDKSIPESTCQLIEHSLDHYLIARQLNDDIHDWVEDLTRGHISFVVAFLLKQAKTQPGTYSLSELIQQLQTTFWHTGLTLLSNLTLTHINQAIQFFRDSAIFIETDNIFFKEVFDPIRESAQQSIITHTDQKKFLKTYSKNIPS